MKLTFIGGTGRSGTSITRKLLGCSRDVATLNFEHRILIDPDGPIEFFERLGSFRDPYKIDIALARMFKHLNALDSPSLFRTICDSLIKKNEILSTRFNLSKYSGWKLSDTFSNYSVAIKEFESNLELYTHRAKWAGSPSYQLNNQMRYFSISEREKFRSALRVFYCSLISNLLETKSLTHFVEDSTWNITYINPLSQLFPEAKFVHVYRDPRDVIASFIKQRWMPNDVDKVVAIYKDLIADILEKTTGHQNCYTLKFENLLKDQDSESLSLCDFLGIHRCENIKNFKLGNGNIGRYLKDFDSSTITYLEENLVQELKILGYED